MRERVAVLVGGDDALAGALEAAGFDVRREGPADVLVLAHLAEPAPEPHAFVDVDDEAFEALWEAPLQRAIEAIAGATGRVVVVTPPGGPAAHAATVEGVRLLATSAALQGHDVVCVRSTELVALAATADGLRGATLP